MTEKNYVSIVLGGKLSLTDPVLKGLKESALILAADRGLDHLYQAGFMPDLLLGDFDSVSDEAMHWAKEAGVIIETYPVRKNKTDGELAIDRALADGYNRLKIWGTSGDPRPDHFLSILLYCLWMREKFGIQTSICDGKNVHIPLVGPAELRVDLADYFTPDLFNRIKISLPTFSDLQGLSYEGLDYPVENQDFFWGQTLLISNTIKPGLKAFSVKLEGGRAFLSLCLED